MGHTIKKTPLLRTNFRWNFVKRRKYLGLRDFCIVKCVTNINRALVKTVYKLFYLMHLFACANNRIWYNQFD